MLASCKSQLNFETAQISQEVKFLALFINIIFVKKIWLTIHWCHNFGAENCVSSLRFIKLNKIENRKFQTIQNTYLAQFLKDKHLTEP